MFTGKKLFGQPHFPALPIDPTNPHTHHNTPPPNEKGHFCPAFPAYKADARAIACPICNTVIPTPPGGGVDPNIAVYDHIQAGCAQPSQSSKKAYTNACSFKACEKRELVPIRCGRCGKGFCIRHRNELDHACTADSTGAAASRKPGSAKASPKAAAAAAAAKRAAAGGKRGSGQSGKGAKDCCVQ
ncbi:hypothetical protein HDU86_008544 [Geranomyces michiganensis]|nr:hypothetical protein HDU86_008544 [Geranomyces michiganensis]